MAEFFEMGGYGVFVFGAMGFAAVLMLLEVITLRLSKRSVLAQIKRNKRMQERASR